MKNFQLSYKSLCIKCDLWLFVSNWSHILYMCKHCNFILPKSFYVYLYSLKEFIYSLNSWCIFVPVLGKGQVCLKFIRGVIWSKDSNTYLLTIKVKYKFAHTASMATCMCAMLTYTCTCILINVFPICLVRNVGKEKGRNLYFPNRCFCMCYAI